MIKKDRECQKKIDKELIKHSTTNLLLHFLHDVIAVNYNAGNELDIKENEYKNLAKEYADLIDNKFKKEDN
jgi:hypothetical protein